MRPSSTCGRALLIAAWLGAAVAASGCDRLPGRPDPAERPLAPHEVTDFATLYGTHCAGCHGEDGRTGAARPMNDPVYLAVVTDSLLRTIIADGVAGTMMPGFGPHGRGTLTDAQVDVLVTGMRERWARPNELRGVRVPSYRGPSADGAPVDPERGEQVYARRCQSCHRTAGSVLDPSYLALVSNQALRSAVIAGRIDLGMPDWRGKDGQAPLGEQEIDDVVAWMAAKRIRLAGAPYGGAD